MNFKKIIILAFAGFIIAAVSWKVYDYQKNRKNYSPVISEKELLNLDNIYTSSDNNISIIQEELNLSPENSNTLTKLGAAYIQKFIETGNPEFISLAEKSFNDAFGFNPENYIAVSELAKVYFLKNRFQKSLEISGEAEKINPYSTYPYGVLADALTGLGMYDEAEKTVDDLSETKKNPGYYSRVSYQQELKGNMQGAIDAMKSAVSAGVPTAENTALNRVKLGKLFYNSGDIETAEKIFDFVINDFPGYAHGYGAMAQIKLHNEEYSEAIELYKKALEKVTSFEYMISLGDSYKLANENEKSDEQYKLADSVLNNYQKSGVDIRLEKARFNTDRNINLNESLDAVKAIINEGSQSVKVHDMLAWINYKMGNYDEALKNIELVLRFGTKDPLMYFHAGKIYEKTGQLEKSKEYLDFARDINPYYEKLYSDKISN